LVFGEFEIDKNGVNCCLMMLFYVPCCTLLYVEPVNIC